MTGTISTPYGVTCRCQGSQLDRNNLFKSILQQIRNIAPATSTMIVRLQFSITQVAHNLGPKGDPRKYTYDQVDRLVAKCNSLGLICLLGFEAPPAGAGPNWVRGNCLRHPGYKYVLAEDWAVFAGNVARHYTKNAVGLHIEIIECGNEDYDQAPYRGRRVCALPQEAAHTATAVFKAVREANPHILVGAPASVSIDNRCGHDLTNACRWWKEFFGGPVPPQADYVNYHYYCQGDAGGVNCCGEVGPACYNLIELADYIRKMNQDSGGDILPIWVTESGFTRFQDPKKPKITCEPPYSGQEITGVIQADLLTTLMEKGRLSGGLISAILWFTLAYTGDGLSLVSSPTHVFKAYTAYQQEVAQHPHWGTAF